MVAPYRSMITNALIALLLLSTTVEGSSKSGGSASSKSSKSSSSSKSRASTGSKSTKTVCTTSTGTISTLNLETLAATNPDDGKLWITTINTSSKGSKSSNDSDKCGSKITNCKTCSSDYKTCTACQDYSWEGGFTYTLMSNACYLVATFDDIVSTAIAVVPSGYRGFDWSSNTIVMNYSQMLANGLSAYGFAKGIKSGTAVMTTNDTSATGASFSSSGSGFTFTLVSAYFTAAFMNNLSVTVTGYSGTKSKASQTFTCSTTGPTAVTFKSFSSLDSVTITATGGTSAYTGHTETFFVVDDIVIA